MSVKGMGSQPAIGPDFISDAFDSDVAAPSSSNWDDGSSTYVDGQAAYLELTLQEETSDQALLRRIGELEASTRTLASNVQQYYSGRVVFAGQTNKDIFVSENVIQCNTLQSSLVISNSDVSRQTCMVAEKKFNEIERVLLTTKNMLLSIERQSEIRFETSAPALSAPATVREELTRIKLAVDLFKENVEGFCSQPIHSEMEKSAVANRHEELRGQLEALAVRIGAEMGPSSSEDTTASDFRELNAISQTLADTASLITGSNLQPTRGASSSNESVSQSSEGVLTSDAWVAPSPVNQSKELVETVFYLIDRVAPKQFESLLKKASSKDRQILKKVFDRALTSDVLSLKERAEFLYVILLLSKEALVKGGASQVSSRLSLASKMGTSESARLSRQLVSLQRLPEKPQVKLPFPFVERVAKLEEDILIELNVKESKHEDIRHCVNELVELKRVLERDLIGALTNDNQTSKLQFRSFKTALESLQERTQGTRVEFKVSPIVEFVNLRWQHQYLPNFTPANEKLFKNELIEKVGSVIDEVEGVISQLSTAIATENYQEIRADLNTVRHGRSLMS